jgi:hypothetical protein
MARMKITERDRDILRRVGIHRFLRSSQIAALVGGSPQQVLRRLQFLYHCGYLERPVAQMDYFHRRGPQKMVYSLTKCGAALLSAGPQVHPKRISWDRKDRSGRQFLEHALMVSDIMVTFELACRRSTGVRFISCDEIPLPVAARASREPYHWFVHVSTRHRVGVIPDAVFGLESSGLPEGTNRAWFFVEADRGTMPVMRENFDQSSYFRKLLSYEATWTHRIHRTRLDLSRFRVLTVTSSVQRKDAIIEACRQLERGHGLFLFTDVEAFARTPDILSHPWATVDGTDSLVQLPGIMEPEPPFRREI